MQVGVGKDRFWKIFQKDIGSNIKTWKSCVRILFTYKCWRSFKSSVVNARGALPAFWSTKPGCTPRTRPPPGENDAQSPATWRWPVLGGERPRNAGTGSRPAPPSQSAAPPSLPHPPPHRAASRQRQAVVSARDGSTDVPVPRAAMWQGRRASLPDDPTLTRILNAQAVRTTQPTQWEALPNDKGQHRSDINSVCSCPMGWLWVKS